MPKVNFIRPDGTTAHVAARAGLSLMRAAIEDNIEGIDAECGGALDCATCHVYVDPAFLAKLPPPSEREAALLQAVAAPRRDNSRLSCQIKLTDELEGLTVQIPETQC